MPQTPKESKALSVVAVAVGAFLAVASSFVSLIAMGLFWRVIVTVFQLGYTGFGYFN